MDKAPLMDQLLYLHSSGGLNFNNNLNYTNILFNLLIGTLVISLITLFLVWRKRRVCTQVSPLTLER